MGIFSNLFGQKNNDVAEVKSSEIDYSDIVSKLFAGYIINSYSNSLRQGTAEARDNYVALASQYQPLTFKQYYDALRQDYDLTYGNGFGPEIFRILSSKAFFKKEGVDLGQVDNYCDCVSRTYESMLATVKSLQEKEVAAGQPNSTDLKLYTFDMFKFAIESGQKADDNYMQNPKCFTRQGFERCGVVTIENSREDMAELESTYPGMIEQSLDILEKGTENAQYVIAASGKEFYPIKPQEVVKEESIGIGQFEDFDNAQ